jgi:iron(III) transport system ATP-binding protein
MEIYRKPASAFVADFVGTMTFLSAEIAGPRQARVGTADIVFDRDLGFRSGSEVRLGLRPEEVRVRNIDGAAPNRLAARVAMLDFRGSFCRAHLDLEAAPGANLLADFSVNLMRDLAIAEGQTLTVMLPSESLRVFAVD